MKALKRIAVLLGMVVILAAPVLSVTATQPAYAAGNDVDCDKALLGIPPWYRGLTNEDCSISGPESSKDGLQKFIWRIVLNVIDIALRITAYIAFFFILYGGFQFMTGGSNSGQIEKARRTLLNAVIGLGISLFAVAIVNLIFGVIK